MGLDMRYLLALSFLLVGGCLKPPEAQQNFGPEVQKALIEKAFNEIQTASPYSIEVGEFAYLEKLQQVESNPPDVIFQRGDTVTAKKEEADYYVLTLVTEIRERVEGVFKSSKKETQAILPKIKSVEELAAQAFKTLTLRPQKLQNYQSQMQKSIKTLEESSTEKVSYHNLEVKKIVFPTPDLVKKRENCGGLSIEHCQNGLPATQISFDKVIWESRGGDKTSFRFVMSEYSPYLASQLSACAQSSLDFQGQRVRVTQCEFIKDFTWGTQAAKIKSFKK
jgi:hypothetical protein